MLATLKHWARTLKHWTRTLKRDVITLWIAARDPRTPWLARWLALAIAAYALSPIDLIPDAIPVLGYLDELIIVPLGILLVIKLVPADLIDEFRALADTRMDKPISRAGAVFVILVWLACAMLVAHALL